MSEGTQATKIHKYHIIDNETSHVHHLHVYVYTQYALRHNGNTTNKNQLKAIVLLTMLATAVE